MKTETIIYDALKNVIPKDASKTILFASVGKSSYEIFFYSFRTGIKQFQQCFQMAENGELDENELDTIFRKIADIIRADERFKIDKLNIITVKKDISSILIEVEHFDVGTSAFQIKRNWKNKNLVSI